MDATFIYPAASAQLIATKRMEVISNNIANIGTVGFKRETPVFASVIAPLAKAYSIEGTQEPTGGTAALPVPTFIILDELVTDFTAGITNVTGNPLDVAIQGEGFFQIKTPRGIRYTRNGSFTISPEGQLVTRNGNPVLGVGGELTLPPGIVSIDERGKVSVKSPGVDIATEVDSLALVKIKDPKRMKKVGDNLFELVGAKAEEFLDGRVQQGALEGANVNPVEEMIAMIVALREYEASQRSIQTAEEIDFKSANQVGKLRPQ